MTETADARRPKTAEEYIEDKLRRLTHPDCIVIAARVLDSHLLAQMLMPLDRSMNTMRRRAGGPSISIQDVANAGQSLAAWMQKAKDLACKFSPRSVYVIELDPVRENELLARKKNVYAFVPTTPEGAAIARMIKTLDAAFLEYRTKAPMQDSAGVNAAFGAVRDLVKEFHDIAESMTEKTETRFVAPKTYESYIIQGGR